MRRADEFRGQRLDAVADVFLSPATSSANASGAVAIYAAAPGTADTESVLELLRPGAAAATLRDLGCAIGVRLGRLERSRDLVSAAVPAPQLVWCPCAEEGVAVTAALTLGRLGALVRPARVTVLWFAGGVARIGRSPSPSQCERARHLACAAVPGASVSLHCLGWQDDPLSQLADLAGRFH